MHCTLRKIRLLGISRSGTHGSGTRVAYELLNEHIREPPSRLHITVDFVSLGKKFHRMTSGIDYTDAPLSIQAVFVSKN